ncbi:MAG: PTS mannitol transporter subunit IICB [Oscillospiraceae bacterium]|jgi:PTS system mannitol-specific IIC component|nr:PTS mannitol transporter subunit IICB [Oscillospiraceae bacterium]
MRAKVQKFGRFLSGMVMPNLGAFIAWGLITALFIATGWTPNEKIATMVDPMLKWLLPLLIGYTGGEMVYGKRGGVVGAIATIGVLIGSSVPMFLGAMGMGPLGAWIIKKFDQATDERIAAGFEMLVNNFSAGIFGGILAILGFLIIGPIVETITNAAGAGVEWLVDRNLLPFASVLVEPAKVLFLNNAINHGVFTPLGALQVQETGRSIMYMIESNPGPGLGLLVAYCLFGKGNAKSSAPGAIIIHFLGGIHEIYFPYVLMNPVLIIAMIGGGASGVLTLSLLGGGLIGAASPGSIFAELAMSPKGAIFANIVGILVAAVVTFLLAGLLMKAFGKGKGELEDSKALVSDMKAQSKGQAPAPVSAVSVKKIAFACDAGMGSSAMGATKLRKKLKAAGLGGIEVIHCSVDELPKDIDVIVCHKDLGERAQSACKGARLITITDFLNAPEYDELIESLK